MNRWTVGFLFRNNASEVALILKTHPEWQKGKLNGLGGTIEEGETPASCMRREFKEEAGVDVADWREYAHVTVPVGELFFLAAEGDHAIESKTEEEVKWYRVSELGTLPTLPNLHWLIHAALDKNRPYVTAAYDVPPRP